jgi:hypothetical protein
MSFIAPPGTEGENEENLAKLVTPESMQGAAKVKLPPPQ